MGMEDGAWNDARRIYESVRQRDSGSCSVSCQRSGPVKAAWASGIRCAHLECGAAWAARPVASERSTWAHSSQLMGAPGDLRVNGRAVPTPVSLSVDHRNLSRYWLPMRRSCPINCALLHSALRSGRVAVVCGIRFTRTAQICAFSTVVSESDPSAVELERIPAMDFDGPDALSGGSGIRGGRYFKRAVRSRPLRG